MNQLLPHQGDTLRATSPFSSAVARSLCLLGGLFVALAVPSHAAVVGFQKVVTTTDKVVNNVPGYQKVVVCSVGPFTVETGDVVTSHVQAEFTWAGTSRCMAAGGVIVATSPTAVDNSSAGYIGMVNKWAGNNLVKALESTDIMTRNGSYRFGANYATVYVNFVAYGQTLPLGTPGPDMVIPAGYAEIAAVVERGVTRYQTTAYQQIPYDSGIPNYYVPVSSSFNPLVQYSYGPLNIPADTMVDVRFQVEASTYGITQSQTQRLGRKVIQTTSATSTSGPLLNLAIQGGATGGEHHATFSSGGGMHFPTATNGVHFNSVLWGYGAGSQLQIETESSQLYGGFAVELRPYAGYWKDIARNITTVDATKRVIYSVGPIDIPPGQTIEVRYQAAFQPSANVAFDSQIIRGTSATATTGVLVQKPLWRKMDPAYTYTNAIHSTAEQVAAQTNGQYYNVVAWLPNGGSLPVLDWGQLEVVFR